MKIGSYIKSDVKDSSLGFNYGIRVWSVTNPRLTSYGFQVNYLESSIIEYTGCTVSFDETVVKTERIIITANIDVIKDKLSSMITLKKYLGLSFSVSSLSEENKKGIVDCAYIRFSDLQFNGVPMLFGFDHDEVSGCWNFKVRVFDK